MNLLLFVLIGLPVFLCWIGYRIFVKKEEFSRVKDTLYTGTFCFAFISAIIYWLQ